MGPPGGHRPARPGHRGGGPAGRILHGLAGSAREFWPTERALAPHFRVLLVDQRGHGRSTTRPADLQGAPHDAHLDPGAGGSPSSGSGSPDRCEPVLDHQRRGFPVPRASCTGFCIVSAGSCRTRSRGRSSS
ncbi:alpha/beta fold hydrolase [Nocardiopsis valliformis]|uniref:alpha/beta fold hydrolase n=1 Tax=Nocardiopsis valliformis TaxID=239974 RepID=UPI001EF9D2C5|nr:alpha/beta fold hydrolase [Nocardiopsis valliformis]